MSANKNRKVRFRQLDEQEANQRERQLEEVKQRTIALINERAPDCLVFGENHQRWHIHTFRDEFFTDLLVDALPEMGYRTVAIELDMKHQGTFDQFVHDQITLEEYRVQAIRAKSYFTQISDYSFNGLKRFVKDGGTVICVDEQTDLTTNRDKVMASILSTELDKGNKVLFYVGAAHAVRRQSDERKQFVSAIETLVAQSPKTQICTVVEVCRELLYVGGYDFRLEDLLNSRQQVGVASTNELAEFQDIASCYTIIGEGSNPDKPAEELYSDIPQETVFTRLRYFDLMYLDSYKYIDPGDEPDMMGAPLC